MPTVNPTTDDFGCPDCGRKFSTVKEWRNHQPECAAAGVAGYDHGKVVDGNRDETSDEDWVGHSGASRRPPHRFLHP
ncbi:MAG TPA: hypothetical protein VN519_08615 [Bryobacteraceae bacterium]|nr:hypothetical protein [Bryobacteraceae bacterium]